MVPVHSCVIEVQTYDARILGMAAKVHSLARWRVDLDDLIQTGRLALLESELRWQELEQHRSQFWTFAFPAVRGAMLDCMFKARRDPVVDIAERLPGTQSYPKKGPTRAQTYHRVVSDHVTRPDHRAELVEHLSTLDPLDREIVERFAAGEDFREIAAHTGVSRSTAHRRYTAAVEAIRACA